MKESSHASRHKFALQAAPENCMVWVSAKHAKYFNPVPKDQRTYIIEDPRRRGLLHWNFPDGTYECKEDITYPYKVPGLPLTFHQKRVKGQGFRKTKRPRVAEEFNNVSTFQHQTDDPPVVCLIDINRVIRICGFKKSFIYEQVGFPQPVRLGVSKRSSVRWVEAEVIQWVQDMIQARNTGKLLTNHR